jgi:hypothetical protein
MSRANNRIGYFQENNASLRVCEPERDRERERERGWGESVCVCVCVCVSGGHSIYTSHIVLYSSCEALYVQLWEMGRGRHL